MWVLLWCNNAVVFYQTFVGLSRKKSRPDIWAGQIDYHPLVQSCGLTLGSHIVGIIYHQQKTFRLLNQTGYLEGDTFPLSLLGSTIFIDIAHNFYRYSSQFVGILLSKWYWLQFFMILLAILMVLLTIFTNIPHNLKRYC